jgi:uncharacterized protein (DUF1330 family)
VKANVRLVLALLGGVALGAAATQTLKAQTPKPGPGFYIVDIVVNDAPAFAPYGTTVAATLEPFGGRFIVRGGKVKPLQGEPPNGRIAVIAFDSVEKAQAWYDSPAYQAILPIRLKNATSRSMIVEGLAN